MVGKKGNAAAIVLVILIIIVLIAWWVSVARRECSADSGCGEGKYCGSDYACHQMPVIEKTIIQNQYTGAASILGVCIIIAAIIIRWKPGSLKRIKSVFRQKQ